MNASDKCTKPNNCAAGYVLMNDKCVKSCADGQAFSQESLSGNTDPVCVACEQTIKQGIVQNTCIKCALDEFFSEDEMKCVKKSSLLHVAVMAHDACWLCANPTDLTECLRKVTNGGAVPNNSCVLRPTGTSSGATNVATTSTSINNALLNASSLQVAMPVQKMKVEKLQLNATLQ